MISVVVIKKVAVVQKEVVVLVCVVVEMELAVVQKKVQLVLMVLKLPCSVSSASQHLVVLRAIPTHHLQEAGLVVGQVLYHPKKTQTWWLHL